MLPYQQITEKTLEEKINLMLNDPKYAIRAKEIGALTVDQIQHPLERATWWLEHIMRHPHEYRNKSPVLKLAWYQYFCLHWGSISEGNLCLSNFRLLLTFSIKIFVCVGAVVVREICV